MHIKKKSERGIILATVSINAVLGDNGLIQSAKNSRDSAENSIEQETGKMNSLLTEYANVMAEDAEITEPGEGGGDNPGGGDEPKPGDPIDGTLAVGPQVADGMTPVKYVSGIGWVKTTETDTEWYNYGEKKWANVVLGDATFNPSGSYEVLDETKTYSMLVWIPRYAYKITSGYHTSTAGNIDIVFLDTTNRDKDGIDYSSKTVYPSATTGSGMSDYVIHPAFTIFTFGANELSGFWVGKFETSNNGGKIQIKGGVQSWRSISVNDIHNTCIGMNENDNSFGLSTEDSVVDPHMMKNTEWGAVAYLSQSIYGKNGEVTMNDNTSYYTGGGNETLYRTNVGQSTTGDVTGIYDMSGGAYEYVAGYCNASNASDYASSLINADTRYKNMYLSYTAPNSGGLYGDAVYETSSGSGASSWYGNDSTFVDSGTPFFERGGHYLGFYTGIFAFGRRAGYGSDTNSFRVVIPVIQ